MIDFDIIRKLIQLSLIHYELIIDSLISFYCRVSGVKLYIGFTFPSAFHPQNKVFLFVDIQL